MPNKQQLVSPVTKHAHLCQIPAKPFCYLFQGFPVALAPCITVAFDENNKGCRVRPPIDGTKLEPSFCHDPFLRGRRNRRDASPSKKEYKTAWLGSWRYVSLVIRRRVMEIDGTLPRVQACELINHTNSVVINKKKKYTHILFIWKASNRLKEKFGCPISYIIVTVIWIYCNSSIRNWTKKCVPTAFLGSKLSERIPASRTSRTIERELSPGI